VISLEVDHDREGSPRTRVITRPTGFRVILEPVNASIKTDDFERKLRLMAGGCGIRVVSAERLDELEPEEEKEY